MYRVEMLRVFIHKLATSKIFQNHNNGKVANGGRFNHLRKSKLWLVIRRPQITLQAVVIYFSSFLQVYCYFSVPFTKIWQPTRFSHTNHFVTKLNDHTFCAFVLITEWQNIHAYPTVNLPGWRVRIDTNLEHILFVEQLHLVKNSNQ